MHVFASPIRKPRGHLQRYEPTVFEHPCSHIDSFSIHSLISKKFIIVHELSCIKTK